MKNRQINFIPLELREKFVIPHQIFPLAIFPAVVLYVSISGISLYQSSSSAQAELTKLEASNKEIMTKLNSSSISEKDIEGANSLQNTMKQKNNWSEIFKEMSLLIPDGVWLTGFGNQRPVSKTGKTPVVSEGEHLVLKGEAGSQESIAEFLSVLEQSHYFSGAQLIFSEKQQDIKPSRFQFEFSIPVKSSVVASKPSGGKAI